MNKTLQQKAEHWLEMILRTRRISGLNYPQLVRNQAEKRHKDHGDKWKETHDRRPWVSKVK